MSGTYYISARGKGNDVGTYTLTVTDISSPESSPQTVQEAPVFGTSAYAFELQENTDGSGDRVSLGTVAATDANSDTVSYSIVAGNGSGSLEIDAGTGELFYAGSGEDHESDTSSFTLTVRASDGSLHADATVTVTVTDVNEAPAFAQQSYAFDLAENADGSTDRISLGTVSATDPESATLAYTIVGGNESGSFEIDASTGELFYAGSGEDYESGTSYNLTVRASDGILTGDATVTVTVTDVNEAPAFAQQSYAYDLAENTDGSRNGVSLGTVSATDPEGDTLSYSIVGGNESGSFEIDASTGELFYVGSGEDYESGTTRFDLTVRASDGSLHADTTATVNVTDIEETDAESLVSVSEPEGSDLSEDTSTTGRVAVDGTAEGEIQRANDRDWFAVDLEAGKTYQINLTGARSAGGTLNLPHLRGVYDADGSQIPGVYSPLAFAFVNPHNRLLEGISSVDIQLYRGEDSQAFFTSDEDGTYYLAVGNFDFSSTGTYTVGVTEIQDDFLRTVDTTGAVEVGSAVTGEIQYANDRDWFAVELTAGVTYKVGLLGADENGGTLPKPWIRGIHDADGRSVSETTYYATDPNSNSELIFRPGEDGTYYVAAGSYMSGNREEEVGTYTVQVSIDDTRVDPTGTSEPTGGDLAADTSTIGRVAVGGSGFGEIGTANDRDWFAVQLEAGKVYRINTDGRQSGGGALPRGRLYDIYDADGNAIPGVDDEPITWLPIHYASPQQVRNMDGLAFFTPDEDGTYYLEVGSGYFETAFGGSTGTGTYTVGVGEMEDDFSASTDTTGTVQVGGTATGESQYEIDRDWFAVELSAGETYKVELLGTRAKGGTLPQPYIWGIHDASGRLISGTSDYASGPHSNSQVSFTPDEDGTYFVAAGNHESGSLASDVGTYTLQVSIDDFTDDADTTGAVEVGGSVAGEIEAQGDRDWFAVVLEAGTIYQIDMEGSATDGGTLDNPTLYPLRDANGNVLHHVGSDRDSGEGLNSRATFTVDEGGTYFLVALSGGHMHAVDSHGRSIGTYTLSLQELGSPSVEEAEAVDEEPVAGQAPQTVSEPDGEDFSAETATTGRVVVGGSATGSIGSNGDRDWFAVELVADREYQIDLKGSRGGDGTLSDPYFRGIYGADGNIISGTTNDDRGGGNLNSQVTFTPTESGTYYLAAGAYSNRTGTYTLSVTDISPQEQQVAQQAPVFGSQSYAFDLAENTDGSTDRVSLGTVSATDGNDDTLTYSVASGDVSGLFEIDAGTGELFYAGTGEDHESATTSYDLTVRASDGTLTADVSVAVSVTDVQEAPVFGASAYGFGLPENTDGSTNRVSLGTVSATDGESDLLTYSITSGNESGLFDIDSASGEVFYTGSGEDYESGTTSFDLTVQASDGALTADTTVTVNIIDVQEDSATESAVRQSISEPVGQDFSADTSTSGHILVGDTVTGAVGSAHDRDWFAVELVGGRTYQVDLKGSPTDDGTLSDPYFRGVYDSDGILVAGTTDDDGGEGYNSRETFTASQDGGFYLGAGAYSSHVGTYTLSIEEVVDSI